MKLVDFVLIVAVMVFLKLGQVIADWPVSLFAWLLATFVVLALGRFWQGERLR